MGKGGAREEKIGRDAEIGVAGGSGMGLYGQGVGMGLGAGVGVGGVVEAVGAVWRAACGSWAARPREQHLPDLSWWKTSLDGVGEVGGWE